MNQARNYCFYSQFRQYTRVPHQISLEPRSSIPFTTFSLGNVDSRLATLTFDICLMPHTVRSLTGHPHRHHDASDLCPDLSWFYPIPEITTRAEAEDWRLSIPQEQRVVILELYTYCGTPIIKDGRQQSLYGYVTRPTDLVPGILQVPQESRAEGLKTYTLTWGVHREHPIYVNYSNDILLFDHNRGSRKDLYCSHKLNCPNALK
jgi:hypothetical protein